MIDSVCANKRARYVSHCFTHRLDLSRPEPRARIENETSLIIWDSPRNHVLTDDDICLRDLVLAQLSSKCAAIQINPSGPRLARMYCE